MCSCSVFSLLQTQQANKSAAPKRKRKFARTIKTSTKKACSTLTCPNAQEASDVPHKQEKLLADMTPQQLRRQIRDLENLQKKNKNTIEDL